MHRLAPRCCWAKRRRADAGSTSRRIPSAAATGTVAGEHSVILAGENERIVLSHVAEDRTLFARGALTGADWLIGKPPGRYSMEDVLGI